MDLQTQQVVAAIGDLAGNVGRATNTITISLTTNAAYAYDAAGNVTSIRYNAGAQTMGLTWNSQYELTAVRTNGVLAESYSYDALGRRVRTITGTVTNYHIHDGIHSLADLDATGAVLRAYTYGPGIDNLLAMTTFSASETNHYYYLTDHLGSVLAITDEDGEIVERYHYDAWGRVTITDSVGLPLAVSAIGNRFGFQGREHSWATGLLHFRARWYDPVTARFLSVDPIGISGGLNLYAFCGNNPVNFTDPYGLFWGELDMYGSMSDMASAGWNRGGFLGGVQGNFYNGMTALLDVLGGQGVQKAWSLSGEASGCDDYYQTALWGAVGTGLVVMNAVTFGRGAGSIATWSRSPGLYEAGSRVLPGNVFRQLSNLDPIQKGALLKQLPASEQALLYLRASPKDWLIALSKGPTPGGAAGALGVNVFNQYVPWQNWFTAMGDLK